MASYGEEADWGQDMEGALRLCQSELASKIFNVHLGRMILRGQVCDVKYAIGNGKYRRLPINCSSSSIIAGITEIHINAGSFTVRESYLLHVRNLILEYPDIIRIALDFHPRDECIIFENAGIEEAMEKARVVIGMKVRSLIIRCHATIWDKDELISRGG